MAATNGDAEGTQTHNWSQSDTEVTLKIPVADNVGKDKLKVKFELTHLSVWVTGNPVFVKELSGKVVVDDSYWALEGSGGNRFLVITLCKKKSGPWRTLTREEEEALPNASELDENFDVLQLEHDDDDPERVEEQLENERKLEARYKKLQSEKGLDNEDTLQTFFALFDNCIQLYRLNKLSDYLEEVVPACRKRDDKYKLKAIQALAFVRWKQSRFREALPLFHEMEDILGKGAALCENIAHTYNSLGNYEKAEDYFRQALKFIEQEHGTNQGNRGGVLLGLGLVRDRLGKHKEGLPVCIKAYEFYKERANGAPASLQAKAGISCAKMHAKLGNLTKAEEYIREAVHMYEVTCGETSPLTASAYHELGKCLWKQRRRDDAQKALKRAYEIESMKDAWELVPLLEIHNLLMDTHLKETEHIEREKFAQYFKIVEYVCGRVRKELPQDGNAAVYYKAAAELKAWGGQYTEAKALFNEAIPLFQVEKSTDCSGLLKSCEDMLAFCDRNLVGTQNSPMSFEIPSAGHKESAEGGTEPMIVDCEGQDATSASGVVIEELDDDVAMPPASGAEGTAAVAATAAATTPAAPAAPGARPCNYRAVRATDFGALAGLCVSQGCAPALPDEAALAAHLSGAGAELCWAAVEPENGELQGFLLCGSDGLFGHVWQLLVGDELDAAGDDTRSALVERCVAASQGKGLRRLCVAAPADSREDAAFGRLPGGWTARVQRLHTLDLGGGAAAAAKEPTGEQAPKAALDPAAEAERERRRRDLTDTGSYYNAWDKMNVEKTLIEEDGGDARVVPEDRRITDDFGVGNLDVASKLTTYSWDQSDRFVSVRLPLAGVGALPAEAVELTLRPHGMLLIIRVDGKQRWFKVPNLCKEIDVGASSKKVKADEVVVKLKKLEAAQTWSDLTDEKDIYQRRREYRINHGDLKGASTEELLADLYKNATDEERAGLRDAMKVNREKRAEEARRARGSE